MSLYTDTYLDQSLNIASKIQSQYKTKACRVDKGVKRASLWVLWRTYMPSILTEIGFLTNPEEENFLGSEKGQNYIALSIFKAFRQYKNEVEGKNEKYDDEIENITPYQKEKDTVKMAIDTQKLVTDTMIKSTAEKLKDGFRNLQIDTLLSSKQKEEKKEVETKDSLILKSLVIDSLFLTVQIISSDKKITKNSSDFKGLEHVNEYYLDAMFKYTVGEYKNLDSAVKAQAETRSKGFPDAFVIAIKNGKRIPVNDAVKLLKQ